MKVPRSVVPVIRTLIQPFSFSVPIAVRGQRFKTPFIKGIGYGNIEVPEPWMLDLLARLVELCPRGGLLDVGVNIGQTLLKFRSIDSSRLYYGFEPNPFCVSFAQELVRINNFANCSIFPAALSDKAGIVGFSARSDADSAGVMRPHATLRDFKQYIAALVFDELALENVEDLSIVKIDVEGAELNVIRGMRRFLEMVRPLVICEVLHAHDQEMLGPVSQKNAQLMDILQDLSYRTARIIKGGKRVDQIHLIEKFPAKIWFGPTSPAECDYLMIPGERFLEVSRAFDAADAPV